MSSEPTEVDRLVAATTDWTVDLVIRLAVLYAREHGTVSSNDLHDLLPGPAKLLIRRALHWLAQAGDSPLTLTGGFVKSRLGSARSARVAVYRPRRGRGQRGSVAA